MRSNLHSIICAKQSALSDLDFLRHNNKTVRVEAGSRSNGIKQRYAKSAPQGTTVWKMHIRYITYSRFGIACTGLQLTLGEIGRPRYLGIVACQETQVGHRFCIDKVKISVKASTFIICAILNRQLGLATCPTSGDT